MDAFWIILTGTLVACTGAVLGTYLVLRKMTMIGDAISHAVLPGIVLSYLISDVRDNMFILIGASLFGVLTTFIIEYLHKKARLQEDASIGVVFTFLFSIGVILISYYAKNIDLDQDCVLYGEIAYIGFDSITLFNVIPVPRAIVINGLVFIVVITIVLLFKKQFDLTTFDPAFAGIMGISATFWHYILMTMVSLTTVASFDSVGAILVVTFFVVPAATAYLLTNKLNTMLLISLVFGFLSAFLGYFLSDLLDASIAGSMSLMSGILFTIVFVLVRLLKMNRVSIAKA